MRELRPGQRPTRFDPPCIPKDAEAKERFFLGNYTPTDIMHPMQEDIICTAIGFSKEVSQILVESLRKEDAGFIETAMGVWPEDSLVNIFVDHIEQQDLLLIRKAGLALCFRKQPKFGLTGCERSVKIKLKIQKTYLENKSNTILKIKDLAAKIK